jgi:hypothetical protein
VSTVMGWKNDLCRQNSMGWHKADTEYDPLNPVSFTDPFKVDPSIERWQEMVSTTARGGGLVAASAC